MPHLSPSARPAPPSRTPSDAAPTLEESAYDFISNPDLSESGILSDDDARTESLASFDGNTPDDLSIINGAGDSEEEDALNTPLDSVMLSSVHSQQLAVLGDSSVVDVTPVVGDSGYTSLTIRPQPSVNYLDFYTNPCEPCASNQIDLVHTVQSPNEPNCNGELDIYNVKYVGVDMHMTVSTSPLPRRDTFRVLIMGYYTHSNADIAEHIKAALHSALADEDANTQVSLIMHHCIASRFGSDKREIILVIDRLEPLDVTLRGGKSYVGNESYPLWDVAIFLHTSLANIPTYEIPQLEHTFEKARLGMRSCGVPIMDLSMYHPLYRAVPHLYTCDRKSLHLRVTTRKTENAKELPCEMLPVDLDRFFAIDPQSLGKHIACITEQNPSQNCTSALRRRNALYDAVYDFVPPVAMSACRSVKKFATPIITRTQQHLRYFENFDWIDVMLGLVIALSAALFCMQVPTFLVNGQAAMESRIQPSPPQTPAPQQVNWADLISHRLSSALSEKPPVSTVATPSAISSNGAEDDVKRAQDASAEDLSTRLHKQAKKEAERNEELRVLAAAREEWAVEVVDLSTVNVTFPPGLTPYKHSLRRVSVFQNGRQYYSSQKNPSHKTFIVQLPGGQVYGPASLRVEGYYHMPHVGKVPFDHSFNIEFADVVSKTAFETVRDLLARELILVQHNAMELSTRVTTGLQRYIDEIQEQTLALHKQAMKRAHETSNSFVSLSPHEGRVTERKSMREQLRQLQKTKQALRRQGKAVSEQLGSSFRAVQDAAQQQYSDVVETVRSLPQWQHGTTWPVRVSDWRPQTAMKRGWGNAQGLVRRLRNGPKLSECPEQQQRVHKGRRKNQSTR